MKKKFLSLLMLLCVVFGCAFGGVACDEKQNSSSGSSSGVSDPNAPLFTPVFEVDYAAKVKLDMSSSATLKTEVTVKTYVDGDTTHFEPSNMNDMPQAVKNLGYLKARYAAVNTPESTGTIEKWGKDASDFTKGKLSSAQSIVLETDTNEWEPDSTGERFLVWIWYKPAGQSEYRNLNIELLQWGLALPSKTDDVRYSSDCLAAITQAKAEKIYLYSKKKDPDFYTGDAIPLTLKELRANIADYNGIRVAFEANVAAYNDWNIYVEEYDEETGMYYGISAFYGYDGDLHEPLTPGNRVRIVGKVSYFESGGTYQITDLKYNLRDLDNPNNIKVLETGGHGGAYTELTYAKFASTVSIDKEVVDPDTEEVTTVTKNFCYAELAMGSSISMKNLKVVETRTTTDGGNQGAISLTCEDSAGNQITVRTEVLKDAQGNIVTADLFEEKTIDVVGIVGYFSYGQAFPYQIQVFTLNQITLKN